MRCIIQHSRSRQSNDLHSIDTLVNSHIFFSKKKQSDLVEEWARLGPKMVGFHRIQIRTVTTVNQKVTHKQVESIHVD